MIEYDFDIQNTEPKAKGCTLDQARYWRDLRRYEIKDILSLPVGRILNVWMHRIAKRHLPGTKWPSGISVDAHASIDLLDQLDESGFCDGIRLGWNTEGTYCAGSECDESHEGYREVTVAGWSAVSMALAICRYIMLVEHFNTPDPDDPNENYWWAEGDECDDWQPSP